MPWPLGRVPAWRCDRTESRHSRSGRAPEHNPPPRFLGAFRVSLAITAELVNNSAGKKELSELFHSPNALHRHVGTDFRGVALRDDYPPEAQRGCLARADIRL